MGNQKIEELIDKLFEEFDKLENPDENIEETIQVLRMKAKKNQEGASTENFREDEHSQVDDERLKKQEQWKREMEEIEKERLENKKRYKKTLLYYERLEELNRKMKLDSFTSRKHKKAYQKILDEVYADDEQEKGSFKNLLSSKKNQTNHTEDEVLDEEQVLVSSRSETRMRMFAWSLGFIASILWMLILFFSLFDTNQEQLKNSENLTGDRGQEIVLEEKGLSRPEIAEDSKGFEIAMIVIFMFFSGLSAQRYIFHAKLNTQYSSQLSMLLLQNDLDEIIQRTRETEFKFDSMRKEERSSPN